MKRGKNPTRAQKIFISSYRLQPGNRLVASEEKGSLTIIHKHTNTVRVLKKI